MFFCFSLGTSAKRRNQAVKRLNELYCELIPVKQSLQKCLKYMCQTQPYRMLRDWTYGIRTDPLPSEENASQPEFTDVIIYKYIIIFFT